MLDKPLCEDCESNPVEYRAFLCKPDGTVLLEMNICMDCLQIVSTTFLEEAAWQKKNANKKNICTCGEFPKPSVSTDGPQNIGPVCPIHPWT